jgi:hypothetical protein
MGTGVRFMIACMRINQSLMYRCLNALARLALACLYVQDLHARFNTSRLLHTLKRA